VLRREEVEGSVLVAALTVGGVFREVRKLGSQEVGATLHFLTS
jgi:hypothetical protein